MSPVRSVVHAPTVHVVEDLVVLHLDVDVDVAVMEEAAAAVVPPVVSHSNMMLVEVVVMIVAVMLIVVAVVGSVMPILHLVASADNPVVVEQHLMVLSLQSLTPT
jgi:hypothetical protein